MLIPAPVMNIIFLHLSIYSETPSISKDFSFLGLILKHVSTCSMALLTSVFLKDLKFVFFFHKQDAYIKALPSSNTLSETVSFI